MKKLNNIKNWGMVLGLSLLSLQGCKKDFLDVAPQGSLTEALFPESANDAKLATNGIYAQMRVWQFHTGGFPILDIISDDTRKGSSAGDAARLLLVDNFTFSSTSSDIYPWYSAIYRAVKSANVVIEYVPEIEMDQALKNRYIAEARFLRAMFYFNLVRAFGDVPMVTTVNADYTLARTSASQIYNQVIIPDLIYAADILPEKAQYAAADKGRATKGAAKALLAKVHLYLGNWSQVVSYCNEIENSGQYDLEPSFNDVFGLQGQHGIESIFEIGALPDGDLIDGGNQFANTQGVRGTPNKGWGFNRPSMSLINAFEEGDVRKDASIIFLNEVLDGVLIQGDQATPDTSYVSGTNNILEIECYNQKVWVPGTTDIEQWGHNVRVIRFAEVLLMKAEALNELGDQGGALTALNRIRTRAQLQDLQAMGQFEMRNAIMKERRVELAMEGNRYYDLIRKGMASQFLGPLGYIEGKHNLFPIPQTEIDLSGGTLTQNPGW
jgi:starch-binding outer membrane protein, SusD/RagB family